MKILMVNKFLYPNGGSETYIFRLGERLQSLGHEVQYFGMEHPNRIVGNRAEQYTKNMDFHGGSRLSKLTYPLKTIYSSDAKKKMLAVLKDFNPDIVHLNNFNYQLTPSVIYAVKKYRKLSKRHVKIIYTAHDYQLVCPNHMMYDSSGNLCENCVGGSTTACIKGRCIHGSFAKSAVGAAESALYRMLGTYKYIDAVICCSEFMKSKLDKSPVLAGKTVVMHNFIEKPEKKEVRKEDYVLYFGRYSREKGIETIARAKNINFICAGSGPMEGYVNSLPNVKNLGFKTGEALEMLIRKAKCSVYPSIWYENCPFSVMESIAHGTPVVGADIGGIPELIRDGETGILFESGNTQAFENAVNRIMKDDKRASQMARNCLDAEFDTVETYTEKLMEIYK